jgi:tRNA G26 N,N-dimethylase Trm1
MWCDFKQICHADEPVDQNCRTCAYSKPVDGPQWLCTKHKNYLDAGEQAAGCGDYLKREAME